VVHRSSETSTNQSDVIIRSDDRFLNLVVDSDSIVSKIYMLNFWGCIDWVSKVCLDKLPDVCQYEGKKKPAGIKLQYFCLLLLPFNGHRQLVDYSATFLMFTNGKIVVCKYIILFYSNLYFCQTHIWTSLLLKQKIVFHMCNTWYTCR
jgi:hypothetical protein